MRNEEECVCSVYLFRCNIFIGVRIIKEMPRLVASGTPCIFCIKTDDGARAETCSLTSKGRR